MMRINETPPIEVHQIRNNENPGGIGENGTVSAAPALANAVFAATGKRLRRYPIDRRELIRTDNSTRTSSLSLRPGRDVAALAPAGR
ncbi:hypothetical protein [Teichococcus wenyumeiae]|uniref:hypothetical protein n=1 Tax=Teichococcus wenyumeiae TaxID=2478470 RepID=UPI001F385444|nr:hypothetical protein [Pseudoroseomonas wenyumeiae]